MADVRLIVAFGNQGQIGINGKLPWRDTDDLKWFLRNTLEDKYSIVVLGRKTYEGILHDAHPGAPLPGRNLLIQSRTRTIYKPYRDLDRDEYIGGSMTPEQVIEQYDSHVLWIAGGKAIYDLWLPFVNKFYISRIPYNGPADTFLPLFPDYTQQ